MTKEEIDIKIKEFWDTRVEGSSLIWNVLQQACNEQDPEKAESMIKVYGLTLSNGLLQQTYDSQGHKYDLPPFVINPALKYGEGKIVAKQVSVTKSQKLNLIFRAAGKTDVTITIDSLEYVSKVKEKYLEAIKMQAQLRFFFNGRELKDESVIGQSQINDSVVIQVFIKPI